MRKAPGQFMSRSHANRFSKQASNSASDRIVRAFAQLSHTFLL